MILTLDENIDEFQKVDSNNFQNELIKLNQDIEQIGNLRNRFYFDAIDKRNKVLHQIEFFKKKEFIKGSKRIIEVPISIYPHLINDNKGIEFNLENLVDIMNNNIRGEIKTNKQKIIVLSDVNSQSEYDILLKENLEVLIQQLQMILDDKRLTNFTKDFKKRIEFEEIIYLGANLNKQSPLFLLSDEHNQLSQAIHSFAQLNEINSTQDIYKHDEEIIFLLKWIRQFKIGLDFEIKPINGIAYNFNFSKEIKPSFVHPLSEMGMGSIQLMTLLLRLATLIRKSKKEIKIFMVVVEEPELNLHPNFQSKLCDLFYEVHKKYQNIRFVIETHSEYIIRKSQLIGKENKLFEDNTTNPFNVIYFDNKNGPYEMIYRPDGKFSNEFGTGFFDESTNLAFDLF
jgi:predicted ATP-dependent endonuclease of OLD family